MQYLLFPVNPTFWNKTRVYTHLTFPEFFFEGVQLEKHVSKSKQKTKTAMDRMWKSITTT